MAGKTRIHPSSSNRRGMAGIAVVVLILLVVLLVQSRKLMTKNQAYAAQIQSLEQSIEEEKDRSEEISQLPEYVETKEYIEKLAREKLGLVYEDEVIFKAGE